MKSSIPTRTPSGILLFYYKNIDLSNIDKNSSSYEAIIYIFIFKVNTHFMGIANVTKADGEHITKGITDCLTERFGEEWKGKVVAMGTDGASVMTGNKSGVVERVRQYTKRPFIFTIHCSAHRLVKK